MMEPFNFNFTMKCRSTSNTIKIILISLISAHFLISRIFIQNVFRSISLFQLGKRMNECREVISVEHDILMDFVFIFFCFPFLSCWLLFFFFISTWFRGVKNFGRRMCFHHFQVKCVDERK